MSVVRVLNIVREYKLGKTKLSALRGVSIEIERGEFVAICGPSGSGKTTLLNIIGCLDKPTTGTVQIVNQEILTLSDRKLSELRNKSIGFIFQNFNLMPVLTAYENVEYPLWILGKSTIERKRMVLKMLEEVGLLEHKNHKPDELSGGQRQRVAIARALVTMPSIVLADEPTANLDGESARIVIDILKDLNKKGQTIVMVTHEEEYGNETDRIIWLRDGKIDTE